MTFTIAACWWHKSAREPLFHVPRVHAKLSSGGDHAWVWAQATLKGSWDDVEQVFNTTLGFEKVIALGLPERSDKRDALTLMSRLSGFSIEWVDGVKPADIPPKAVPYGIDTNKVGDNFLGGWRSHMNVIRL
jgi:hypothetical protein